MIFSRWLIWYLSDSIKILVIYFRWLNQNLTEINRFNWISLRLLYWTVKLCLFLFKCIPMRFYSLDGFLIIFVSILIVDTFLVFWFPTYEGFYLLEAFLIIFVFILFVDIFLVWWFPMQIVCVVALSPVEI